jgi:signal transduction histidine kinase
MLESEFLICHRSANAQQIQLARLLGLLLLLGCLAIFPYRAIMLPSITTVVPVIDTMHFLFGGITAAILLSLASILRSRALVVLGAGFFLAGLLAIGHALTYPNVFSPTGLLGADINTSTWLYLTWHTAFTAAVITYALLRNAPNQLQATAREPARAIFIWLTVATIVGVGTILLTTAGAPFLTGVLKIGERETNALRYLAMLPIAIGILLLWRGKRSVLDIGLTLTLWALLTESVVILPDAGRFTLGWYTGRVMGLLSGLFVLLMLLIDMSRLYGRLAILTTSHKRERENRLMVGEGVGAFIAHELRQPLASMMLNAGTARQLCAQGDEKLSAVLDELVQNGRLVNQIVESTRAAVRREITQKSRTDINQLIRDTLHMTSHERRGCGIKVELRLDDRLPSAVINPLQLQQVLVNLFANAADAMNQVTDRPRILVVQSACRDSTIVIWVKDSGAGIQPGARTRIFDAFFTTKEHGTGMGLSICRSVIKAHGGTIHAAPGEPFGAVFEICLPMEGAAMPAPSRTAEPTAFPLATSS